ncbi:MAG TPA: protoporphyrinogen oxidase [Planctomycetota bacterium]|nr:protoporphyrinogen oxidase [Planctomycetota bacterium]
MTDRLRVAIVGGGITGLAAAHRLAGEDFLLLEADERLGGKIRTERVGHYVLEGGPDCFLSTKPGGVDLCRALGLEGRLRGTDPTFRRTYVKRRGQLHPLPEGITGLVPSRIRPLLTTRVLSPHGRLRAALEPFVPAKRSGEEESIASFVSRRFGREAYDWLVEPLLSGIYGGDGRELSLEATFPQLASLEREGRSVLRAMVRAPARDPSLPPFVTLAGGLSELVEALALGLPPGRVRLGAAVEALERGRDGFRIRLEDGSRIDAESAIVATPAHASARILGSLDPDLARELEAIRFVATATVSLAFPVSAVPRPLDGYGYVSPRAEGEPLVACTWTSNKFPDRVPPGHVLVRFFLGRAGMEEVVERPDAELLRLARGELERLAGITAEPSLTRVFRWRKGIPQYALGHLARLGRIETLLARHPGLALAGASYGGVGIPDCVASGRAAAASVLRALGAAA